MNENKAFMIFGIVLVISFALGLTTMIISKHIHQTKIFIACAEAGYKNCKTE